MQQSQKILNYSNENYLLISSTEIQVVTLEFDSQYYTPFFHFLHYQLLNHLNSTRPLLILDLEFNFRSKWKNIYSSIECSEQNGFKKYVNNMYLIKKEDSLNEVLKQIVADNNKSLEVLISGVELAEISIFNMIREILKQPFSILDQCIDPQRIQTKRIKKLFRVFQILE